MERRLVVYSPCGTSVLTNAARQHTRTIYQWANARSEDEVADRGPIKEAIAAAEAAINGASIEDAKKLSAELNGLLRLYPDQRPSPRDHYVLLATDTWLGKTAANLIERWLRANGAQGVTLHVCNDLRTSSLQEFHWALTDLVEWLEGDTSKWREAGYSVVFNLTGGFKSIQGFLQSMAHLYADESVYIFESAGELLRLPRLPLRLDVEDELRHHREVFARLEKDLTVERAQIAELPSVFVVELDSDVGLSAWGKAIWLRGKQDLYQQEVFPPPTDQARFGPRFLKNVEDLPRDRKHRLNEQFEWLARFLERGENPKGLGFQQLRTPAGESTHEFYAWSDRDARRVYCHFEQEGDKRVLVLDRLDRHL